MNASPSDDPAFEHVPFDGWSAASFKLACADAGVAQDVAQAACPRGALDLAAAFHRDADEALAQKLGAADLSSLRYSQKVAFAVMERLHIAAPNREAVRKGIALFALPQNARLGAELIWNTADTIWSGLGDTSDDLNWYTKRAILSGVYSSSVIYWLGDETPSFDATQGFVDRRIENVMAIESAKARVKSSKAYELFRQGPGRLFDKIKAPGNSVPQDLPGFWRPKSQQPKS